MPRQRSTHTIARAKKRQPFCRRCLCRTNLIRHHVWALADGGPDEIEDVDVLCHPCHREWHDLAENLSIPYDRFVLTVPAHLMLLRQVIDDPFDHVRSRTAEKTIEDFGVGLDGMALERGITRPTFPAASKQIPKPTDQRIPPIEIAQIRVVWG